MQQFFQTEGFTLLKPAIKFCTNLTAIFVQNCHFKNFLTLCKNCLTSRVGEDLIVLKNKNIYFSVFNLVLSLLLEKSSLLFAINKKCVIKHIAHYRKKQNTFGINNKTFFQKNQNFVNYKKCANTKSKT